MRGLCAVDHHGQRPGRALHLGGVDHLRLSIEHQVGTSALLGQTLDQRRVELRCNRRSGLERQLGPGVGQQTAFAVHQKGEALFLGAYGRHFPGHGRQPHIGADDGRDRARGPDRIDKADRQLTRAGVHVGRRDARTAFPHGLLEPVALGAVVVLRHGMGEHGTLVRMHEVGVIEAAGLLACQQERNRVRLLHRRFQRAGDALLVLDPVGQCGCMGLRELADVFVDAGQRAAARRPEGGHGQREQRGHCDCHADEDQAGTKCLKHDA